MRDKQAKEDRIKLISKFAGTAGRASFMLATDLVPSLLVIIRDKKLMYVYNERRTYANEKSKNELILS